MTPAALPTPTSNYWAQHQTVVITWPGDMPGVASFGRQRRLPSGHIEIEYTRDELVLAVAFMRELRQSQQARVTRPVQIV